MNKKEAWLLDYTLNDMPMAYFQEVDEDTVTQSTKCFKTKEEAIEAINSFKANNGVSRKD